MTSHARRMLPQSVHRLWIALSAACYVAISSATAQSPSADPASAAAPLAHLAAGDAVVVVVFGEKERSGRPLVDDRNHIALPRLPLLDVSRLTADMLRDTIRVRYASFLRDPSVDVRALRRVTVNGSVLKPDVYFV